MRAFRLSVIALGALVLAGCSPGPEAPSAEAGPKAVKIAFIVKMPEEKWFQLEWKFADQASKDLGFELIQMAATDGDQVLPKIENAAAQGAQGLIICTPDVKLGTAIVNKCKERNLKLLTVDDQLVDADGKFLDVPHLGISARKIGNAVGDALLAEMKNRGWTNDDTALMLITWDQLDTTRERTDGTFETLTNAGFSKDKVFRSAEKSTDVPGSRDAATVVLTRNPNVKHWLIASVNDAGVIGAVRATEAYNIPPEQVLAIGIGGDSSPEEFKKDTSTGLFGSILLQAKRHGYDTAEMMFHWIKEGKEPPKITYTDGILITHENFKEVLKSQGLEE